MEIPTTRENILTNPCPMRKEMGSMSYDGRRIDAISLLAEDEGRNVVVRGVPF